jgi:hypothetical protein
MMVVVGAVMVGLWSLGRDLPDRFPQTATTSTALAPPSSQQRIDYGQWRASFDHVFWQSRWYPAVSEAIVTLDNALIIRTTLAPGSLGSALALRACEGAVDAEGYASVRFDGGVLVFGVQNGTSVPLAASTVGGCYD